MAGLASYVTGAWNPLLPNQTPTQQTNMANPPTWDANWLSQAYGGPARGWEYARNQLGASAPVEELQRYATASSGGEYIDPVDVYARMASMGIINWDQIPAEYQQKVGQRPVVSNAFGSLSTAEHRANLEDLMSIEGLTDQQRESFLARANADPWVGGELVKAARDQVLANRADEEYNRATRVREEQLGRIGEIETEGLGLFNKEIERLSGFEKNPNLIRSDAELGSQLTAAEANINQAVDVTRTTAARQLASSGLRSSGKVSDVVRQSEQNAGYQRARLMGDLLANITESRQGLEQKRLGFKGDIMSARETAESSGIANLSNLSGQIQGLTYDPFETTSTSLDITGLGKGVEQWNAGQAFQWGSLILSSLMNAAQMGQQGAESMMSMFKKGG